MKRKEYRIGPGAASLLLVVVVVSMSVLGLLALINARGDQKLTERGVQFSTSEYAASAQAERRLAELDGILVRCAKQAAGDDEYMRFVSEELPDGMRMEGNIVFWEQESECGRTLNCAVEVKPFGEPVRYAWKQHMFVAGEDTSFE